MRFSCVDKNGMFDARMPLCMRLFSHTFASLSYIFVLFYGQKACLICIYAIKTEAIKPIWWWTWSERRADERVNDVEHNKRDFSTSAAVVVVVVNFDDFFSEWDSDLITPLAVYYAVADRAKTHKNETLHALLESIQFSALTNMCSIKTERRTMKLGIKT